MSIFDYALDFTLKHEGGYVNDPQDPGGETIYGISRRHHPDAWRNGRPTKAMAAEIYRRDYWNANRCDELPAPVAIMVFDTAVNCGSKRAVQMLQRAVGTTPDGALGPVTLRAIKNSHPHIIVSQMADIRLGYYRDLSTFGRFGKGWTNRVNALVAHVAQMDGVA